MDDPVLFLQGIRTNPLYIGIQQSGYLRDRVHCDRSTAMKSMTCRQLGGDCDQKLSAATWNDMVNAMTKHVIENHPEVAKKMEKMHNQDPKKRGREMRPKWEAAPEV